MNTVPEWRLVGDWFDICSCNIPCPCEFAQAPTNNACSGVLAWHIREGNFGDVKLDGLNLLGLSFFEGNVWAGESSVQLGLSSTSGPMSDSARLCRPFSGDKQEVGRRFLPA
jgi:hypothetical protein